MKKRLEDGTEVDMTPEEELAVVSKEHEAQKAIIDKLETEGKLPTHERHMVFPTEGESTQGFGVEHVEFNQSDFDKLVVKPEKKKPEELSMEELGLASMIMKANDSELPDEYASRLDRISKEKFGASFATMTSTGTATGEELRDVGVLARLWRDTIMQAKVAGLFAPIVSMPTNPYALPVMGDATFLKPSTEGVVVAVSDLATAERTLTAYTVKAMVSVSHELEEDSIIALLPSIRARLIENAAKVIDRCILVADSEAGATGNINDNNHAPTTQDWFLGFDGLVKYALVTNPTLSASLGAFDITDFATLLGLLDAKYIANPSRLAWITDVWVYLKALQIAEFHTWDKSGDKATILTGKVADPYGIPMIVSDTLLKSATDGTVSADGGHSNGRLILVHRDAWRVGFRRTIKVATERKEAEGYTNLVATMRMALMSFNDAGAHTAVGHNITV